MRKIYLIRPIQWVMIFTLFWISLQATQAATLNVCSTCTYTTIADAITAASTINVDTIAVAAGAYPEDITIGKSLILQGAGAATTTISGAGAASIITITASTVKIDGFTITNAASTYGIKVANQSHISITGNTIHHVKAFGIAVSSTTAIVDDVTITNNMIRDITSSTAQSAEGIVIGFSTGVKDINSLLIQGNTISNISCTSTKGAYGIHLNHAIGGVGNTGCTVSPQILNNTISNLNGVWAHGIGLEGCTPYALVQGNQIQISSVNATAAAPLSAPGTDAIAVMLEDNASANTVMIVSNSFTGGSYGVFNKTASNPAVTVGSNWWNCTAGANGGGGCAATYPTTGANAVTTGVPCTSPSCTVSAPIIDLRSSGRATIFATEIIE